MKPTPLYSFSEDIMNLANHIVVMQFAQRATGMRSGAPLGIPLVHLHN